MLVERSADRGRSADDGQRIPVRGRVDDCLDTDRTPCAGAVLDDKGLTETSRQPLTDQARENVGGTTGVKPTIKRTGRVG